jgi:hypothetical protein
MLEELFHPFVVMRLLEKAQQAEMSVGEVTIHLDTAARPFVGTCLIAPFLVFTIPVLVLPNPISRVALIDILNELII